MEEGVGALGKVSCSDTKGSTNLIRSKTLKCVFHAVIIIHFYYLKVIYV